MVRALTHRWARVTQVSMIALAVSCSRGPEKGTTTTTAPAPAIDTAVATTPPPSLNLRRSRGGIESDPGSVEGLPTEAGGVLAPPASAIPGAAAAMIADGFIVETTLQTAPERATVTTVRRMKGDGCQILTEATIFEDRSGTVHRGEARLLGTQACDPARTTRVTARHEALRDDLLSDRPMAAALKMAPTVALRRHGLRWARVARVSDAPLMGALLGRLRAHAADPTKTIATADGAWVHAGGMLWRYAVQSDNLSLTAIELGDQIRDVAP
jgi:hypothetical protein